MPEQLYTIEQAAKHYGVCARTIHRIIRRCGLGQKLPSGRLGVIVLTQADFDEIGRNAKGSRGNPQMKTAEGQQKLLAKRKAKRPAAAESSPATDHPAGTENQ